MRERNYALREMLAKAKIFEAEVIGFSSRIADLQFPEARFFETGDVVREFDRKPYAVFIDGKARERIVETLAKQLFEVYKKAPTSKKIGILRHRYSEDIFAEFADEIKDEYPENFNWFRLRCKQ